MTRTISKDLIKNLSDLAKINLSDEQIIKYTQDLSSVMGYMDEIKDLNVENIPETSRVSDEGNVLREDIVKESLSQNEALKNSKNTNNGYFLVPQILKND